MRISDWSSDVCSSDLVDETRRATDQRAARKHQLGHRLPAAIVDRPCAVRHALAAFEQFADRRVCLPALHLLEGREIRIAVIEPGDEAERDLPARLMIEKTATVSVLAQGPAPCVDNAAGNVFFGRDVPQFLDA